MIDTFNHTKYKSVKLPENEKSKSKWDLEEKKNFINGIVDNKIYKIQNITPKSNDKALLLLHYIYNMILILKHKMLENIDHCIMNNCNSEAIIFIQTPHSVQEIPENGIYDGINKPKNIVKAPNDNLHFKRDNDVRPGKRHVMLRIRRENGQLRAWNSIRKLLLHELSHSMCNHCRYREKENHEEDFHKCEDFITYLANNLVDIQNLENIIKETLY